MKLDQPYNRIIRPLLSSPGKYARGSDETRNYIADQRYAKDRYEIIRAYHILEKDLIGLFEYIEPSDANLKSYSYRTYELLLRAATEFELNAKKILEANGYSKKQTNIYDYYKINAATRLSEYKIFINIWANEKKEIKPFVDWSTDQTLKWYQDYNSVKHNRHDQFSKASLENLLQAVAAVFSIVFAQFYVFIFNQYQPTSMYEEDDNTFELSSNNTLFSIVLPRTWTEGEMYDFDWASLRIRENPFKNYPF